MSATYLLSVDLDEASIRRSNALIDQERRVAIYDLLQASYFVPQRSTAEGYSGPYRLALRIVDGRLHFDIAREDGSALEVIILAMTRFRNIIRSYFAICDSYYQALHSNGAQQIETIDMARRGLHDEAAAMLSERLAGKIDLDHDTARRLFTLICVLHIRS